MNPSTNCQISIRNNSIVILPLRSGNNERTQKQIDNEINLVKGTPSGELQAGAIRKIKKYCRNWIEAIQAKDKADNLKGKLFRQSITFVTLTLSSWQLHDDQYMNRHYLGAWLKWAKRKYGVVNYLWKSEPQKNGNLHYHILIDKYIPWQDVRKEWNLIQGKNGIISEYRKEQMDWHKNGFTPRTHLLKKWPMKKQKAAYEYGKKTNWTDPNSTDIHALKNIDNPSSYIIKYMAKTEEERLIEARCWGCSDNLRELKDFEILVDNEVLRMVIDAMGDKDLKVINEDHYILILGGIEDIIKEKIPNLYDKWQKNKIDNFYRLKDPIAVKRQKQKAQERIRKWNEYYYEMRMKQAFNKGERKYLKKKEEEGKYTTLNLFNN